MQLMLPHEHLTERLPQSVSYEIILTVQAQFALIGPAQTARGFTVVWVHTT